MKQLKTKDQGSIFSLTWMLVLVAMISCALWGSATPAIKTGYKLLTVEGVASIMLFAGILLIKVTTLPLKAVSSLFIAVHKDYRACEVGSIALTRKGYSPSPSVCHDR